MHGAALGGLVICSGCLVLLHPPVAHCFAGDDGRFSADPCCCGVVCMTWGSSEPLGRSFCMLKAGQLRSAVSCNHRTMQLQCLCARCSIWHACSKSASCVRRPGVTQEPLRPPGLLGDVSQLSRHFGQVVELWQTLLLHAKKCAASCQPAAGYS